MGRFIVISFFFILAECERGNIFIHSKCTWICFHANFQLPGKNRLSPHSYHSIEEYSKRYDNIK